MDMRLWLKAKLKKTENTKNNENTENIMGIKLPMIYTSYKLWINGTLYNSIGTVGKTRKEFSPKYFPDVVYFNLQNSGNDNIDKNNEIEIIIQVANFMHRRGGICQPIVFGTAKQIKAIQVKRIFTDIFLFSSLMIVGFYQIFMYFTQRKNLYALYLGIISFILSLRTLLLGEMYLVSLSPAVPQELFLKTEYLTLCIGLVIYVFYMESLIPEQINRKIGLLFKTSALLFAIFVIVTPARIYNRLLAVIQLITILICLYFTIILKPKVLKEKKKQSLYFLECCFCMEQLSMIFYTLMM